MSERIPPERSEELSFSRAFFGYDPIEVRAYIAELKGRPEQPGAPAEQLSEEVGPANDYDLAAAIDAAVSHIAEVLEAARAAAQKIRDQAGRDAEDSKRAAVEQTRRLLASAEAEAYALRKDAWEMSAELLESADAEHASLRSDAERKALETISSAERNAHRKLAAARRDSENAMQTAAAEADQMFEAARIKGQEIIRSAEELAAAANERTDTLEQRQKELTEEIGQLESRLEGPPSRTALSGLPAATVRVIPPDEAAAPAAEGADLGSLAESAPSQDPSAARLPGDGWADGTATVRLVMNAPASPAVVEVDALDVADEVARLNEAEASRPPHRKPRGSESSEPNPAGVSPAGRRPEPLETAAQARPAPAPPPPRAPRRERTAVPPPAASAAMKSRNRAADELGDLFLKLRHEGSGASAAVSPPRPVRPAPSPAEHYDRLIPVVNRALRAVKRRLTDIQGEQVAAAEADPEGWQPQPSELASSLTHLIAVMEREAAEQGRASASEMTGARLDAARGEVPAEGGAPFLSALLDDVAKVVKAARNAGVSDKELTAAAARVHRTWRIDEAERRLRFLAGRSYHRGLMSGLAEAGVGEYRIEANGGCGECADLAQEVLAGDQVPAVPVHPECRCLVIPA